MVKSAHYVVEGVDPYIEYCACLPCLKGSETADAVVNDNPVDCQSRGMTEPQRDGDHRRWWRDIWKESIMQD